MESPNVKTHRAGHEAFNQRDFVAMTRQYADSITWTDHAQGRTFRTGSGPFRKAMSSRWRRALTPSPLPITGEGGRRSG